MFKFNSKKPFLIITSIISIWAMTMASCDEKKKEDDPKPVETPGPLFKYTSNGKDFIGVAAYTTADTLFVPDNNKLIEILAGNADESESLQFLIDARSAGTFLINAPNATYDNKVLYYFDPFQIYEAISGTVTISKYDLVNKKISGTFSLNLGQNSSSTTILKVITNGVFNDVPFNKK